jgi:hypothetical protein
MEEGIEQPSCFLFAAMLTCVACSLLVRWFARHWLRRKAIEFPALVMLACLVVGGPCLFFCLRHHFCMAGHFRHPPHSPFAYLNDLVWILAFVWVAIAVFSLNIKFRHVVVFLGINSILVAGVMIGAGLMFLIPLWLFGLTFALACYLGWIE